jgi:hypothetical protein
LKFKSFLFVLLTAVLFTAGCAGLPKGANQILDFKITPDKGLASGTIVSIEVKTTDMIEKVFGSVDVPGAFKVPLKYDSIKKLWAFKAMIPMGVAIPKGEYTAWVEAVAKDGQIYKAEKKVTTY